jgi:hypothetical protein
MDEPSGSGRIRASDTERERFARFLATAFADGRLDLAEYDIRVAAAYAAVYRDELRSLIADLPPPDLPLFDIKPARPVPASAPATVLRSGPPAAIIGQDRRRPYGWPLVLALFAGALCLARLGWFGPFSVLLLLVGLATALGWVADAAPRGRRPPR